MEDELIYKSKLQNIEFCLIQSFPMIYIDMSKLSFWERASKKKHFVLWDSDIKKLKEFISLYEQHKMQNINKNLGK